MHKALGKGINCLSAEELAQGRHYGWSPRGTKVGLSVNLEAVVLSETEFQEETQPMCHLALPSGYSHRKGKRSKRYRQEAGARASRVCAGSPGFGSQSQEISSTVGEMGSRAEGRRSPR